ncbi:hypothetical protein CY35_19G077200 [Sphagnum magellanicum]|nr:hypothetical protein CY35_19G077200 [Sphagnum magellanicum]
MGSNNRIDSRLLHLDGGDDPDSPETEVIGGKKKRGPRASTGEKNGKGLRHFSLKVCEKVESKGRTTYNEVADELVSEFTNPDSPRISPDQDEKNIRRRVYDALNVLMAMGIILKDKKDIQWKGLPSSASLDDDQELHGEGMRVRDRKERIERIEKKAAYLHDLQAQMTGLENLVSRNERLYHGTNSVPAGGVTLPFILVQTQPQATVEVEISEDMQVVHFDFNSTPFELHDDAYVLKALSLQEHQGAKSTEVMGRRGFDDGLGCKFEEDSSPLSSIFQHSSFPPRTSPYYPMSMPSVAKGSLGMLQVSSSRVKQENLS